MRTFLGKYRGTVVDDRDPLQTGRIQVTVPDVFGGGTSSWAMPCVPVAGPQSGVFVLPTVGSGVWVEFEQGDPDFPIWVGGFWGSALELPSAALGAPAAGAIVLQTPKQNGLAVTDLPGPQGGIILRSAAGASIVVNDLGITIDNGKGASITLKGPTVDINRSALEVI